MATVKVKKLNPKAIVPKYMSEGAAGCDVSACLEAPKTLQPLERAALSTGLAFEIPPGFEIQVRPRSGLSFKQGITVVNAPGTIDSDYRGELKVLLVNLNPNPVTINPGDRIAQLVLSQVETIKWEESETLEETARAAGGFGSTGLNVSA